MRITISGYPSVLADLANPQTIPSVFFTEHTSYEKFIYAPVFVGFFSRYSLSAQKNVSKNLTTMLLAEKSISVSTVEAEIRTTKYHWKTAGYRF